MLSDQTWGHQPETQPLNVASINNLPICQQFRLMQNCPKSQHDVPNSISSQRAFHLRLLLSKLLFQRYAHTSRGLLSIYNAVKCAKNTQSTQIYDKTIDLDSQDSH